MNTSRLPITYFAFLWSVLAFVACSNKEPEGEDNADASIGALASDSGTAQTDAEFADARVDSTMPAGDSATDAGLGDRAVDAALQGDGSGADAGANDAGCSGASGCPTGNACDVATGTCTTTCSSTQPCNGGCCNGTTCALGTDAAACGTSGMCADCSGLSTGAACIGSGVCGCSVTGDCPCPAGWTCPCGAAGTCADTPSATDRIWAQWPMPNSLADVEAGAPNPESYTDNGDGTVTDNVTGLMWQQAASTSTFAWGSASTSGTAQNYCSTLSTGGHDDWRLPTGIELVSIVDWAAVTPSIELTYFPGTPGSFFWSSTPVAGSPSYAWYVDFGDGDSNYVDVTYSYNVRCVR